MVRKDYGILRFLGACTVAFLLIFGILFAFGFLYGFSESSDITLIDDGSDIPVFAPAPMPPEPSYETETPSSVTAADGSPVYSSDFYTRTYSWTYGYPQTITLSIPTEYYDYYRNKSHIGKEFDHYALSEDDRLFLGKMIDSFKEQGEKYNFTDDQVVLNIISFVQAMPYTSDYVTTGYDEYPRYPIETLVDGGGDCEDSAILAAALLLEMGYGVVLIELPGHMALGVKGSDNISGTYYTYNGERYYYVETTSTNFDIGELPAEYVNAQAHLYTMNPMPTMDVSIRADYVESDRNYVYYRVRCNVTNTGPTTGQNVSVTFLAESSPFDMTRIWSQSDPVVIGTLYNDASGWAESTLRIPRQNNVRFTCVVAGDNFNPEFVSTKVVYIN